MAKSICGLEKKTKGFLNYKGRIFPAKDWKNKSYMVMQDVNHQLFTESVLDEVILGIKDITEEEKIEYAKKILSVLDLLVYKDRHPMSL